MILFNFAMNHGGGERCKRVRSEMIFEKISEFSVYLLKIIGFSRPFTHVSGPHIPN